MKLLSFLIFPLTLALLPTLVQANDAINVATYIEPPFADKVNGKFVGRNIRLSKLIAKKLNKKVNFITCPMARCILMMQSGQADMIVSVLKTDEREEILTYIEPGINFQKQPISFFTLHTNKVEINSFEDLKSLIIGQVRGARYFEKFDNNNELTKVKITTRSQMIKMLLKGRIDVFIAREESIRPLIDKYNYQKLRIAQYQYLTPVTGYIAISKNSYLQQDIQKFSSIIKQIKDSGELDKVYYKKL
ncbi:substrate-binding periplasmic protein [Litorilituus lipolyticus]|uniref:Transporter substrate-binding domain-containing protein n=1 Tax=Litorilituus lipolyticus TaxID=2491017 RepID=A0A502KMK6_9GAMM|nr:transporter substrate-binding domain-containing protein [Litorilituus lipolyticus]TPH12832.1 transporter substrate-binding domain-containing protein [Litorilituus lipolyticus]